MNDETQEFLRYARVFESNLMNFAEWFYDRMPHYVTRARIIMFHDRARDRLETLDVIVQRVSSEETVKWIKGYLRELQFEEERSRRLISYRLEACHRYHDEYGWD